MADVEITGIKNGIEFFTVKMNDGGPPQEDCQCARCGSSCTFVDCGNCGGEGVIEADEDDWQGFDSDERCDWCRWNGGWWRCISSKDYCEKNPRPGREDQPVIGMAEQTCVQCGIPGKRTGRWEGAITVALFMFGWWAASRWLW